MNLNDYVIRTINGYTIAISKKESCKIFFSKEDVIKHDIPKDLSIAQILEILASKSKHIPLVVRWEITNRCNLNCDFCYIHNHIQTPDISFNEAKPVLDWLIGRGMLFLTLTGGECTLNKDFIQIYDYLKNNGIIVKVFTNGIVIKDDIFKLLLEKKPRRVEITLYGLLKDDERAYKTLLKLKENEINVLAKMTITKENLDYYEEIKQWCSKNNIPFKFDSNMIESYDGKSMENYSISLEEKANIMYKRFEKEDLIRNTRPLGIKCFNCHGGTYSFLLDSEFNLKICARVNIKINLFQTPIEEAYLYLCSYVDKYKDRSVIGCISCTSSELCTMCFANVLHDKEDNLFINKEFCNNVHRLYELIQMKFKNNN